MSSFDKLIRKYRRSKYSSAHAALMGAFRVLQNQHNHEQLENAMAKRAAPGRVEGYPTPSGKINLQIVSGGRFDNVLFITKQGYERKAGALKAREAAQHALITAGPIEYITREEYLKRQARRRREAAQRKSKRVRP
jgi:hypothetical protein